MDAIQISGVTKTFGETKAVDDLTLTVPQGAVYGFIGPNGSGKTTTMRMIVNIIYPDSGTIRVFGEQLTGGRSPHIGYLPEERGLYRRMNVRELLEFHGELRGGRSVAKEVREWLARFDLAHCADRRIDTLSKGMSQKVQFIAAAVPEPKLLILDEPFSGLDPVNARLLRDLIQAEHARGTTILFCTHVMQQAEQLCEHIVMIHDGRKVLDDPLSAIRGRHQPRELRFEPYDPAADVDTALQSLDCVAALRRHDGHYRVLLAEHAHPAAAMQAVAACLPPARLELLRPSLEDVFIDIVQRAPEAPLPA